MEDSEPVIWKSNDGMDYEILPSEKKTRGTIITLKLSEDAIKIFDSATIRMTIRKYCYFAPADIFFVDTKADRLHEEAEKRRERRKQKRRARHSHLHRFLMFPLTTSHLSGQRSLPSVRILNISSSITLFLTTAGILCSGSTLIWIILSHSRVSFISRRLTTFISHSREGSRSITTRYSLPITSKRSFLISYSSFRAALTAQIFLLTFPVLLSSRMNM